MYFSVTCIHHHHPVSVLFVMGWEMIQNQKPINRIHATDYRHTDKHFRLVMTLFCRRFGVIARFAALGKSDLDPWPWQRPLTLTPTFDIDLKARQCSVMSKHDIWHLTLIFISILASVMWNIFACTVSVYHMNFLGALFSEMAQPPH